MKILRKIDMKTFFKNILIICKNIIYCVIKGQPIRCALLCDINIKNIPSSTQFPHPFGIVIREDAKFGDNCQILQCVTIGSRGHSDSPSPIIGNNVEFGANSIVLGSVNIGNNSKIGAGAVILKDIPANTIVVGLWK